MISFELSANSVAAKDFYNRLALDHMRPISRKYDEQEHEMPTEWVEHYWNDVRHAKVGGFEGESDGFVQVCVQAEELCWGDAGLYLRIHQIMSLRYDEEVDLTDIAGTHPPIVEALEAGDVELAVRLVSEHANALADFDPASIADPE